MQDDDPFEDVYDEKFDIDELELDGIDPADSRLLDDLAEGGDIDPEEVDVDGLIEAGVGYVSINRFEQAVEAFDRATRFDSDNQEAWVNKGFAHAEMEEYDRAIGAYDETLRVDKNTEEAAMAYLNKAYAEYETHRGDPLETVQKAIEVDDRIAEAWYNRAFFLNERDQHEEALRSANNAISLGLRTPETLEEKARALESLGRHDEAGELREEVQETREERLRS